MLACEGREVMYYNRIMTAFVIFAVFVSLITGCGAKDTKGKEPAKGKVGSPAAKSSTGAVAAGEAALKSANAAKSWAGASMAVTLDYKGELVKDKVFVSVGGKQATVVSAVKNTVQIKLPKGIAAGKQPITATVEGKACKGELSVEIAVPVIEKITSYSTGPSIDIEVQNVEKDGDDLAVYIDGSRIAYAAVKDMGKAGKYAINVVLQRE